MSLICNTKNSPIGYDPRREEEILKGGGGAKLRRSEHTHAELSFPS